MNGHLGFRGQYGRKPKRRGVKWCGKLLEGDREASKVEREALTGIFCIQNKKPYH